MSGLTYSEEKFYNILKGKKLSMEVYSYIINPQESDRYKKIVINVYLKEDFYNLPWIKRLQKRYDFKCWSINTINNVLFMIVNYSSSSDDTPKIGAFVIADILENTLEVKL